MEANQMNVRFPIPSRTRAILILPLFLLPECLHGLRSSIGVLGEFLESLAIRLGSVRSTANRV